MSSSFCSFFSCLCRRRSALSAFLEAFSSFLEVRSSFLILFCSFLFFLASFSANLFCLAAFLSAKIAARFIRRYFSFLDRAALRSAFLDKFRRRRRFWYSIQSGVSGTKSSHAHFSNPSTVLRHCKRSQLCARNSPGYSGSTPLETPQTSTTP